MKLQLDRPHVLALTEQFPDLMELRDQLRFGHRIELRSRHLPAQALVFLADLFSAGDASGSGRAAQLRSLVAANDAAAHRFQPGDPLESVLPALVRYLGEGTERGWLFAVNVDGKPLPWVPTRIDYVAGSSEELGKVLVELKAHARAAQVSQSLRITEGDLQNQTLAAILAGKGFLKETPALLAAYEASVGRYFDWRGRYGTQFAAQGMGFLAEDPTATHRDSDWTRKDQVILSAGDGAARLVNDEGILPPRDASRATSSRPTCAAPAKAATTTARTKSRPCRPACRRGCSSPCPSTPTCSSSTWICTATSGCMPTTSAPTPTART